MPFDLKRLMAQPATSLSLATQEAREGRAGQRDLMVLSLFPAVPAYGDA